MAAFVAFAASSADTCGEAEALAATLNLRRRGVDVVANSAARRRSRLRGRLPKGHARDFDVAVLATMPRGASAGRDRVTGDVIACARESVRLVTSDVLLHAPFSTWSRSGRWRRSAVQRLTVCRTLNGAVRFSWCLAGKHIDRRDT
jgi:hypothetical protein